MKSSCPDAKYSLTVLQEKKTSKITKYTKLKQNLTEGDLDFSCPVIQEQFAASMSTHTYSIYTRAGALQKMLDEDNH